MAGSYGRVTLTRLSNILKVSQLGDPSVSIWIILLAIDAPSGRPTTLAVSTVA